MTKCHDCSTLPGQLHEQGCDVERCAVCGLQAISCGCVYEVNGMSRARLEEEHPKIYVSGPTEEMERKLDAYIESLGGRLPWTGRWPGEAEAEALGWFSRWVEGKGWVRCERADEGAGPDLNRFFSQTTWNPKTRKYRSRTTPQVSEET